MGFPVVHPTRLVIVPVGDPWTMDTEPSDSIPTEVLRWLFPEHYARLGDPLE